MENPSWGLGTSVILRRAAASAYKDNAQKGPLKRSVRQNLVLHRRNFGRNEMEDVDDGGCEIDGNLGPPISSSAIIKSFGRAVEKARCLR